LHDETRKKHLSSYEKKRIDALADSICTYKFIGVTHYLHDILSVTAVLCQQFQAENCSLHLSHSYLNACLQTLQEDFIQKQSYGKKTPQFLRDYSQTDFLPSISIEVDENEKVCTQKFFNEFAAFLKANIEQRFGNELKFGYLAILNVERIRKLSEAEVSTYGIEEIDKLIEYYGNESVNN
jgi:hypothetical protein